MLEFVYENKAFHGIVGETGDTYTLFGHGGMLFWFISSLCLTVVCLSIFLTFSVYFEILKCLFYLWVSELYCP